MTKNNGMDGDKILLPTMDDLNEDQKQLNTPLSSANPYFTTTMTRRQVEKPFQLVRMEVSHLSFMQFTQLNVVPCSCAQEIPTRLHRHLPESRVPAVLLCRNQSWAVSYSGDLKCKKLGAEWRDFAVDNSLRIGDAWVFEIITPAAGETGSEGDGKVVFWVQVLRGDLPEEITSRSATSDEPIVIVDN
ncbi:B3 domain-containing protein [Panicum miliaceum]|uniref:B3 domain-containing protein n=1 Tax=Panicum miliaceum TaxID=4540 RepID=A0A3L6RQW6_PANMI|nr:B3 domain-containing protein [Panicum miliaceum]